MKSTSAQPTATSRQYATFRLGSLLLGVEVTRVQEVLRYQSITAVPLAPPTVEGLINLRGQIVVAIDTRRSLGLPPLPADQQPMNIVIQSPDGLASLLVDEIGDVVEVLPESYTPVPETLPAEQRELIVAVYRLPQGLMLALDTHQVLETACR